MFVYVVKSITEKLQIAIANYLFTPMYICKKEHHQLKAVNHQYGNILYDIAAPYPPQLYNSKIA